MRKMFLFAVLVYLALVISVANVYACGHGHGNGNGNGNGGGNGNGNGDHVKKGLLLFPHDSIDFVKADDLENDPLYNGRSDDPWLDHAFVVEGGTTTIDVFNKRKKKPATDAVLIVSVEDLAELDAVTVMGETLYPEDFQDGTPKTQCHEVPIERRKKRNEIHPAPYAIVEIGDIPGRGLVQVPVTVEGSEFVKVNFTATAVVEKKKKNKCVDLISPFRMDVTMLGGAAVLDCNPEMAIRLKTNGETIKAGSTFYYQIIWSSIGSCDLTGVVVSDALPTYQAGGQLFPAVDIVNVYPDPTAMTPFELIWDIGDIESWRAGDMLFDVRVSDDVLPGDELVNTACVESRESETVCREITFVIDE